MIKAVIIDDHTSMRNNLKAILGFINEEVEIMGEASGVQEGVELVNKLKPELLFLDVEMQDGTGFDLLSQLPDKSLKVIFITGHDAYALKAFKFSAIDYVLKPVDPDDLSKAIAKAKASINPQTNIQNLIDKSTQLKRLVLSDLRNTYLVDINDIIRVESEVNYTRFIIASKSPIVVSKTLKHFDELLSASGFFRSHQSHLVNLRYFDRLDKSEGGVIFLNNGESVPISMRKREKLLLSLEGFTTNNQ